MEEPVRVLNLFTIMNRGGAETMVMNYYRTIDRTKVQYDFMVHRQEKGAYDDEIEALGGRIFRMPAIRPWTEKSYREAVREFYQNHNEYKIIHSHMSELGYYDFIEAKKAGVPVRICHAHNRPYGFDWKSPVRWYYKKQMLPYITHMFMCGEASGEWLYGKKNRNKFIQLNNAIDAKKYVFDQEVRKRIRRELNIQDKQKVIGHVGRFNIQKNHDFIIEIFREIHNKDKNAVLLLIGNDMQDEGRKIHEKVKKYHLEKSVLFLGVQKNIDELLQAMDVFLFPSLFEGLSVASIEAQAAGLPVIISDKVPIECKKTDLVRVVSLKESVKLWSKVVLEEAERERKDTYIQIKEAGFDIKNNAKKMQKFYLECYMNHKE